MIVIRLSFLVSVIIAANFVQCIDLGESGLVFNAGNAYASTYHNYKPRDYQFEYAVSDPHTGDHKSQWETKDKGVVRGAYSLLEPDGTTRIVEYIADDDGFRAVVKKIGIAIHPSGHAQEVSEVQYHGTAPHETAAPGLGVINVTPVGYPTFNTYSGRAENYGETIDDSKYLQIQKLLEIPQLEAVPQLQQHQAITLDQQHQILPTVPLNGGYQNQEILYQPTVQNLQGHAPEYYPLEYSQKLKFEAPVQYRTVLQEVPKTLQLEPQVQYSAQYQAQPEQYQAQPEVSWKGSEQWKGVPIQIQDVPNVEYQQQVQIQQAPRTPYEIPLAYYRKPSLSESLNLGQKQQINVAVQSLHPHGESSTNFVGSNNYAGEYSNHRLSAVPYQGQGQWEKPLMPYDFVINHPVLQ